VAGGSSAGHQLAPAKNSFNYKKQGQTALCCSSYLIWPYECWQAVHHLGINHASKPSIPAALSYIKQASAAGITSL
jgi:hypothetical protein